MRIAEARVRNYRCVLDSGWFTVEPDKTVLVGPNEAGKTAVLHALLRINPSAGITGYDPAADIPRRLAADAVDADLTAMPVATVRFALDDVDRDLLPSGFDDATYVVERRMGNNAAHWLEGGPAADRDTPEVRDAMVDLARRVPMFVYFDSRFTDGLAVDLERFADRYDQGFAAPTQQDLGNLALFRLLDATPRQLLGLDAGERDDRLAAVGQQLSRELRRVWRPSGERVEASTIEVVLADGRLSLVARDDSGVRVPLPQRSSGFRWLVSFLVVFLAESSRSLENTVIMLDEPGTSLHPGKQAEFRATLSRLGRLHQTLFTTHSPYLLAPDDLERVRSVEHVSTDVGTTVHTGGGAVDHAVTAPLLEAVGLRLADELFAEGNSILFSSLSDYWYTSVALDLLGSVDGAVADATLLPVGPVSQITTLSAFLGTQGVRVVALLDTEGAGVGPDLIARRVNGANVVRPAAVVERRGLATVEDLFAHTLLDVVAPKLGWSAGDVDRDRPVLSILADAAGHAVDRRRLARAFIDWAATATADDIDPRDRTAWTELIELLETALS